METGVVIDYNDYLNKLINEMDKIKRNYPNSYNSKIPKKIMKRKSELYFKIKKLENWKANDPEFIKLLKSLELDYCSDEDYYSEDE